jgi:hypothetical protein
MEPARIPTNPPIKQNAKVLKAIEFLETLRILSTINKNIAVINDRNMMIKLVLIRTDINAYSIPVTKNRYLDFSFLSQHRRFMTIAIKIRLIFIPIISGNIISFEHEVDISTTRENPAYEEVKEVVKEEVKKTVAKKSAKEE